LPGTTWVPPTPQLTPAAQGVSSAMPQATIAYPMQQFQVSPQVI
jgi:hypothetical protein